MKKTTSEIAEVASLLWSKGWAESNAGNISVINRSDQLRKSDKWKVTGNSVLTTPCKELANAKLTITASGTRMRDVAQVPDKNVVVLSFDEAGESFMVIEREPGENGFLRPTSELPAHLAIYSVLATAREEDVAIIHTHATELVSLTHSPELKSSEALTRLIWSMHPEARIFIPDGIGFVAWEIPGTSQMGAALAATIQHHKLVVAEKHGVFATGRSLIHAFDLIDIASKSIQILMTCRKLGFEPEGLSDSQLRDLGRIMF